MGCLIPIRRALLSISDKRNIVALAQFLKEYDVEIISTGGTAKVLAQNGIGVTQIGAYTGFDEILDGRVKTLHPKIYGAILAKRDLQEHQKQLQDHEIGMIDLVVVNLYPFADSVDKGLPPGDQIELIDIGGLCLIRAAAKNHDSVCVLTHLDDYALFMRQMSENNGKTDAAFRQKLAAQAFGHVAAYDSIIARWLAGQVEKQKPAEPMNCLLQPDYVLRGQNGKTLRYGENPHQQAKFYTASLGLSKQTTPTQNANTKLLQGKALSYNNILDGDHALTIVHDFAHAPSRPLIAIIKHGLACGFGTGEDIYSAWENALSCDPGSAFGAVIGANCTIDAKTAQSMAKIFVEVILAPDFSTPAREILSKKKNLRLLTFRNFAQNKLEIRSVSGGFLMQETDTRSVLPDDLRLVSEKTATSEQIQSIIFAAHLAKHAKSNAIILAKNMRILGIGAGTTNRVAAGEAAIAKAKYFFGAKALQGAVAVSDGFFPKQDGIAVLIAAGVTAILQPGGSLRDSEMIATVNQQKIAMFFSGIRQFRH